MIKRILLIIAISLVFTQEESSDSFFSGNANFYFISKLEDLQILKLPYRMLNTSYTNSHNDFEININASLEYMPSSNNYSFSMDDPQDFLIDLREFYLTWYGGFIELRIGKQIQSWGFVDENSPLDNSCAYDYNFLFEAGSDRKIGTNSLAADVFYKNLKFGFTASPFHSTNRLPSSNAEFPIQLPVTPKDYQFMDVDNMLEGGVYGQFSLGILDIGLSYFKGYDRIFNFAGINVARLEEGGGAYVLPILDDDNTNILAQDTVFSYRKTDVLGFSSTILLSALTIRADAGYFTSNYVHENVERPYYNPDPLIPGLYPELSDTPYESIPSLEKAKYYQTTLQVEYSGFKDIDFLFQYFMHDTLSFSSETPLAEGEQIYIPIYDIYIDGFDPYNFFYPGMGSSLALLTKNALLLVIEKSFINGRASIQLRNLIDLEYYGFFGEINTEYKITDKITSTFAVNYIKGNDDHPMSEKNTGDDYNKALDYTLNQMEDFSHFRIQVRYSF